MKTLLFLFLFFIGCLHPLIAQSWFPGALVSFAPKFLVFQGQDVLLSRDMGVEVEANFFGDWYPSTWISATWDVGVTVDNAGSPSEGASFQPEIDALYFQGQFLSGLGFILGRQHFVTGTTLVANPSNPVDASGDLKDPLSYWLLQGSWNSGAFSGDITWIPTFQASQQSLGGGGKWEGFLNPNSGNVATLGLSWFAHSLNLGLRLTLVESEAWNLADPRLSGAFLGSWSILPNLALKGEFLAQYDLKHSFDSYEVVAGILVSPLSWLELHAEYVFNSHPQPLLGDSPLDWDSHFVFFLGRMDVLQGTLSLIPSLLVSLGDGSLRLNWDMEWTAWDSLTVFSEGTWFTGPPQSLFSRNPVVLEVSLGLRYDF
ncbi:MAG: hypothetical protein MI717_13010 [Spirochaetales bacterium]|nr:hypothetical protein [Spirochaetales bacterium]